MEAIQLILQVEKYLSSRTGINGLDELTRSQFRAFKFDFDVEAEDLCSACDLVRTEVPGRMAWSFLPHDKHLVQKVGKLILSAVTGVDAENDNAVLWEAADDRRIRLMRVFNLFIAGLGVAQRRRTFRLESRDPVCRFGIVLSNGMNVRNLASFIKKLPPGTDADAFLIDLIRLIGEQPDTVSSLDLVELIEDLHEKTR